MTPPSMPKASHPLILSPGPNSLLSPAQRRFNKLLKELESLRESIAKRTLSLENDLKDYASLLAPSERLENEARVHLLLKLGEFWTEQTFLKKGQRTKIRELILEQKDLLLPAHGSSSESPLHDLIQALMEDWKQEEGLGDEAPDSMQELFSSFLDPDLLDPFLLSKLDPTQFTDDMSPKELAEEYKRQAEALADGMADDMADPQHNRAAQAKHNTKQNRREQKAAQKEAELAESKDRTLATIYKQLAKVLHPDLERDPQRQSEKLRLMQQVTEAYANKDLFTLLKLEVEHLRKDEGDVATLTNEKLNIYTAVLCEQIDLLRHEHESVVYQPRFSCISRYVLAFYPRKPLWKELALQARLNGCDMSRSFEALCASPSEARKELRAMLKSFDEALKAREAYENFSPF